jgi:hypothetical protein
LSPTAGAKESAVEMKFNASIDNNQPRVNAFPPDMELPHIEQLLGDYRDHLRSPRPHDPPEWYIRAIIDVLEARLNHRPVAS